MTRHSARARALAHSRGRWGRRVGPSRLSRFFFFFFSPELGADFLLFLGLVAFPSRLTKGVGGSISTRSIAEHSVPFFDWAFFLATRNDRNLLCESSL